MKAKKKTASESDTRMLAVKGFDRDLRCRGFQYAVGETYEHNGRVIACKSGFHACEMPLDVFSYYPLSTSRYASVVALGDVSRQENSDSKIASGGLYVEAEIKLPDIIKRAVDWVMERAKGNTATGYSGHAAATGNSGHAAATGNSGHAATTDDRAHAASTGNGAHAAATGNGAHAATTGYGAHAAATGNWAHAATTGNGAHAATTGYGAHAAATGNRAHAASTGNGAHAAATGNGAHAAAAGKWGVAAALGINGTAQAGETGAIVLAHWAFEEGEYRRKAIGAFEVGTHGVEPGKTYRLNADGRPEEVK